MGSAGLIPAMSTASRPFLRLCIYCGSSRGTNSAFAEAAAEVGRHLAANGIGLVYGGGHVGLMGIVADAALAADGEVIGVIPQALQEKELGHDRLTEMHVVGSMHERKQLMVDLSDGFIALPGGVGTLDELFETFTWLQLGFHRKPVGLLNVAGYFDRMSEFLDLMTRDGFMKPQHRSSLIEEAGIACLIEKMSAFQPPDLGKWMERMKSEER